MNTYLMQSVSLAFAASLFFSCASSGAGTSDGTPVDRDGPEEVVPYDANALRDQRSAGVLMKEIDMALRAWNNIVLKGSASKDMTRVDLLESSLRHEVKTNFPVIVDQLQTGPLVNRQIAAAALGFSAGSEALGPLLAALDDRDDQVIANALLGLSALAAPATPVGGISNLLADADRPVAIRNNAGRALRALDLASLDENSRSQVIDAARLALGAEDAAVRVHGSLILAQVADMEAIGRLAPLLMDPSPLVARAASRSIARIGSVENTQRGRAARALSASLDKVNRSQVRPAMLEDLQRMSGVNYGDDMEAWVEFAHKLP